MVVTQYSFYDPLSYFTGLLKNCCNAKKMFLNTKSVDLNAVLVEVLPFMTQLKEIKLSVELTEERMQIISKNSSSIDQIETIFRA